MKTAVEWIAKELYEKFEFQISDGILYNEIIEQAKEMEQQQMTTFGKAVAEKWGMVSVPMSNIKELLDEHKSTWGNNVDKKTTFKNGTDLDMEMFAFLSWLDFNRDVETVDGLLRKDGYEWYNSQWKSWLHNSDAGQRVLNYSGTVTWWGGNPGVNDDVKTTDKKINDLPLTRSMAGETTIEFPKQSKPEPYNPNRAQLDTMTFKFYQEANCVDGAEDDSEELIVEAKSSLGIDGDGGAFFVLRTKQWAFDGVNEFEEIRTLLKRVEVAVNATNPTSIHVK
jgi:hypothetical protein